MEQQDTSADNYYFDELEDLASVSNEFQPESFRNRRFDAETEYKELQVKRYKNDMEDRKNYTSKIFWFNIISATCLFFLILDKGMFRVLGYQFLSDEIILALISLMAVNVLGLLVIVMKYLFPSDRSKL